LEYENDYLSNDLQRLMSTPEQKALEERFRLEVQLRALCEDAGIARPLSTREREIGLVALRAKPNLKRGRPGAGPSPSQTAYQHFGVANWYRATTCGSYEAAYEAAASFCQSVTPHAVKRNHLSTRKFFADISEEFEGKGAEYWSWWLAEIADCEAPDMDK
jgi:hypothetical protein